MADTLNEYTKTTGDWRSSLRQNQTRTRLVILLFFLIYGGIGLLVDLYLYSGHYPKASLSEILTALLTLHLFPIATCIMVVIAAISLWVSYAFYDRLMLLGTEYQEITPETAKTDQQKQLYNVVEEMKISAGLAYMPRVFLINADYMNAFASGYSEKSAMVAITKGLMDKLTRDELQAVMAHEVSHIRHLDIKLTLTASLLANLSLMVLDVLFYNTLFNSDDREESKGRNGLAVIILILRYVLPIISMLLLLYLSRRRELMADAGCVELTRTNEPLARALIKISDDHTQNRDAYTKAYQQTAHENVRREAYIFDPFQAGIKASLSPTDLFSTHPSLATRLAALGFKRRDENADHQ